MQESAMFESGPASAHQHLVALGVLKVTEVDRDRLGKRKNRAAEHDHDERQEHGAKGVDVRKRVQRDAPPGVRRLISQGPSGERMGALVHTEA